MLGWPTETSLSHRKKSPGSACEKKKRAETQLYTCWLQSNLPIFPSARLFFARVVGSDLLSEGGKRRRWGDFLAPDNEPFSSLRINTPPFPRLSSLSWFLGLCSHNLESTHPLTPSRSSSSPEKPSSTNKVADCDPASTDCNSRKYVILSLSE